MNRPPPYFPQSQLSPPDPNRYKKFKRFVVFGVIFLLMILTGVVFGIYFLVKWTAS